MKILCIGDVVGDVGVSFLCRQLPKLKRENNANICIVNGENADTSGKGITKQIANEILAHGADVITTGNHALYKATDELYTEIETLLMPANFPACQKNAGTCELDFGAYKVFVANLGGAAYGTGLDNPFFAADALLKNTNAKFKIIDFHADSTAEKKAFAYYLDGKVSAIFGTHTHVQTADEQILPNKTGYITDIGMTGPAISVIGTEAQLAIKKQMYARPVKFAVASGKCELSGVLFDLDDTSGLCKDVKRIKICE